MALQIDTDMEFQRRAWFAQRIGWIAIAVIVGAALLGVFGSGPLSGASSQGMRLNLDFQRFARLGQTTRFRVMLAQAPAAQLDLSRSYLENFRIERITPEPQSVSASQDWISYTFTGEAPFTVDFDLYPEKFGIPRGAARAFGETVLFRQFVYP